MASTPPISTRAWTVRRTVVFLFLVGFGLLAGAGTLLHFSAIRPLTQIYAARSWIATPCTITTNQVIRTARSANTQLTYSYAVDGRQYESTRSNFFGNTIKSPKSYHPGRKVICYVDPSDPTQAVLSRELRLGPVEWAKVIGSLFFALWGGCLIGFAIRVARIARKSQLRPLQSGRGPFGLLFLYPVALFEPERKTEADDSVVLKPTFTPLLGVAILGFLFLLFVGSLVFLLFAAVSAAAERKGQLSPPEYIGGFAVFCLLLFLAVGSGAYLLTWVLRLFNPRPVLTLSHSRIPLGGRAQLKWQFTGQTRWLRSLMISIKATETAQKTGDVPNQEAPIKTKVFFEQHLFVTREPDEIATGEREVTMPTDAMHSFRSPHNSITWSVSLRAEIPNWPDVIAEYPFTVTPYESTLA